MASEVRLGPPLDHSSPSTSSTTSSDCIDDSVSDVHPDIDWSSPSVQTEWIEFLSQKKAAHERQQQNEKKNKEEQETRKRVVLKRSERIEDKDPINSINTVPVLIKQDGDGRRELIDPTEDYGSDDDDINEGRIDDMSDWIIPKNRLLRSFFKFREELDRRTQDRIEKRGRIFNDDDSMGTNEDKSDEEDDDDIQIDGDDVKHDIFELEPIDSSEIEWDDYNPKTVMTLDPRPRYVWLRGDYIDKNDEAGDDEDLDLLSRELAQARRELSDIQCGDTEEAIMLKEDLPSTNKNSDAIPSNSSSAPGQERTDAMKVDQTTENQSINTKEIEFTIEEVNPEYALDTFNNVLIDGKQGDDCEESSTIKMVKSKPQASHSSDIEEEKEQLELSHMDPSEVFLYRDRRNRVKLVSRCCLADMSRAGKWMPCRRPARYDKMTEELARKACANDLNIAWRFESPSQRICMLHSRLLRNCGYGGNIRAEMVKWLGRSQRTLIERQTCGEPSTSLIEQIRKSDRIWNDLRTDDKPERSLKEEMKMIVEEQQELLEYLEMLEVEERELKHKRARKLAEAEKLKKQEAEREKRWECRNQRKKLRERRKSDKTVEDKKEREDRTSDDIGHKEDDDSDRESVEMNIDLSLVDEDEIARLTDEEIMALTTKQKKALKAVYAACIKRNEESERKEMFMQDEIEHEDESANLSGNVPVESSDDEENDRDEILSIASSIDDGLPVSPVSFTSDIAVPELAHNDQNNLADIDRQINKMIELPESSESSNEDEDEEESEVEEFLTDDIDEPILRFMETYESQGPPNMPLTQAILGVAFPTELEYVKLGEKAKMGLRKTKKRSVESDVSRAVERIVRKVSEEEDFEKEEDERLDFLDELRHSKVDFSKVITVKANNKNDSAEPVDGEKSASSDVVIVEEEEEKVDDVPSSDDLRRVIWKCNIKKLEELQRQEILRYADHKEEREELAWRMELEEMDEKYGGLIPSGIPKEILKDEEQRLSAKLKMTTEVEENLLECERLVKMNDETYENFRAIEEDENDLPIDNHNMKEPVKSSACDDIDYQCRLPRLGGAARVESVLDIALSLAETKNNKVPRGTFEPGLDPLYVPTTSNLACVRPYAGNAELNDDPNNPILTKLPPGCALLAIDDGHEVDWDQLYLEKCRREREGDDDNDEEEESEDDEPMEELEKSDDEDRSADEEGDEGPTVLMSRLMKRSKRRMRRSVALAHLDTDKLSSRQIDKMMKRMPVRYDEDSNSDISSGDDEDASDKPSTSSSRSSPNVPNEDLLAWTHGPTSLSEVKASLHKRGILRRDEEPSDEQVVDGFNHVTRLKQTIYSHLAKIAEPEFDDEDDYDYDEEKEESSSSDDSDSNAIKKRLKRLNRKMRRSINEDDNNEEDSDDDEEEDISNDPYRQELERASPHEFVLRAEDQALLAGEVESPSSDESSESEESIDEELADILDENLRNELRGVDFDTIEVEDGEDVEEEEEEGDDDKEGDGDMDEEDEDEDSKEGVSNKNEDEFEEELLPSEKKEYIEIEYCPYDELVGITDDIAEGMKEVRHESIEFLRLRNNKKSRDLVAKYDKLHKRHRREHRNDDPEEADVDVEGDDDEVEEEKESDPEDVYDYDEVDQELDELIARIEGDNDEEEEEEMDSDDEIEIEVEVEESEENDEESSLSDEEDDDDIEHDNGEIKEEEEDDEDVEGNKVEATEDNDREIKEEEEKEEETKEDTVESSIGSSERAQEKDERRKVNGSSGLDVSEASEGEEEMDEEVEDENESGEEDDEEVDENEDEEEVEDEEEEDEDDDDLDEIIAQNLSAYLDPNFRHDEMSYEQALAIVSAIEAQKRPIEDDEEGPEQKRLRYDEREYDGDNDEDEEDEGVEVLQMPQEVRENPTNAVGTAIPEDIEGSQGTTGSQEDSQGDQGPDVDIEDTDGPVVPNGPDRTENIDRSEDPEGDKENVDSQEGTDDVNGPLDSAAPEDPEGSGDSGDDEADETPNQLPDGAEYDQYLAQQREQADQEEDYATDENDEEEEEESEQEPEPEADQEETPPSPQSSRSSSIEREYEELEAVEEMERRKRRGDDSDSDTSEDLDAILKFTKRERKLFHRKRPRIKRDDEQDSRENSPDDTGISKLSDAGLLRYREAFDIPTAESTSREDLEFGVRLHFRQIHTNPAEAVPFFIHAVRNGINDIEDEDEEPEESPPAMPARSASFSAPRIMGTRSRAAEEERKAAEAAEAEEAAAMAAIDDDSD